MYFEEAHQRLHRFRRFPHGLRGAGGLLYQCGVLLGHLIHLGNGGIDLFNPRVLLFARRGNLLASVGLLRSRHYSGQHRPSDSGQKRSKMPLRRYCQLKVNSAARSTPDEGPLSIAEAHQYISHRPPPAYLRYVTT